MGSARLPWEAEAFFGFLCSYFGQYHKQCSRKEVAIRTGGHDHQKSKKKVKETLARYNFVCITKHGMW